MIASFTCQTCVWSHQPVRFQLQQMQREVSCSMKPPGATFNSCFYLLVGVPGLQLTTLGDKAQIKLQILMWGEKLCDQIMKSWYYENSFVTWAHLATEGSLWQRRRGVRYQISCQPTFCILIWSAGFMASDFFKSRFFVVEVCYTYMRKF